MKKILIKETEKQINKIVDQFANKETKSRVREDLLALNTYLIEVVRPTYIMTGDISDEIFFQRVYIRALTIASYGFINAGDLSINNIKIIMIAAAFYGIGNMRNGESDLDATTASITKSVLFNQRGLTRYLGIKKSLISDVVSVISNACGIVENRDLIDSSSDLMVCSYILSDSIISYLCEDTDSIIKLLVGEIMDNYGYDNNLTSEDVAKLLESKISYLASNADYDGWYSPFTEDVFKKPFVNNLKNIKTDNESLLKNVTNAMTYHDNRIRNQAIDVRDCLYFTI